MHGDLGRLVIPLLAQRKGAPEPSPNDINAMKEPFIDCLGLTWMSSVVEFTWWLERAGLAVVLQRARDGYATMFRLTKRGSAVLDRSDDDPLIPGFLERIKERCPDLPDGVVSLLVDARACFDNALLRPAVMLMGVAYELAIETVLDKLQTKGLVPAKTLELEAGMRLRRVREFLRSEEVKHVIVDRDDKRRVEAAYDFADQLRLWRNDAAHTKPAYDYENAAETETILASAGWHLSGLWLLATAAS